MMQAQLHIPAFTKSKQQLSALEVENTRTIANVRYASLKSVDYLPMKDIDFTSTRGKKRKLDDKIDISETMKEVSVASQSSKPTDIEMEQLF